jgi:serine phosphatase RsbU (regulator of sigma subunit)
VEAVNANDEEFDEPRLLSTLEAGVGTAPKELLERLMASLDLFVGSTPQHDDVTCLLVKSENI